MPRLVIAGSNAGAVASLHAARSQLSSDEILCIAPVGGATHSWHESLSSAAADEGVECIEPVDVNAREARDRLSSFAPDLMLSIYYNQLFSPRLLRSIRCPILNFHPSLLPRHRGVAPIIWAIVEGDDVTGLTVHHVDEGIDTGRVLLQRSIPIHPLDTGYSLHQKLHYLVKATAETLLRSWVGGEPIPVGEAQRGVASMHTSRDPRLNHLDWRLPTQRIRNVVRALAYPLPSAYSLTHEGKQLFIDEVEPHVSDSVDWPTGAVPGMITLVGDEIRVSAADGLLAVTSARIGAQPDASLTGSELAHSGLVRTGEVLS